MDSVRKATQGMHGVAGLRTEDITSEVCKVDRPSRCTCGAYVDCSDFVLDQEGKYSKKSLGKSMHAAWQCVLAHPAAAAPIFALDCLIIEARNW